jgi:hypothetical protein
MSTTFEDRLLVELRAEVERLRDDALAAPKPARARVLTARRAGLGLAAACAVTAATVVALPGSGASSAYAVEQHPDGTVTVHLYELSLDQHEQEKLVGELREAGVNAEIEYLPAGYQCAGPRGEGGANVSMMEVEVADTVPEEDDDAAPAEATEPDPASPAPEGGPEDNEFVMRAGDTLIIENQEDSEPWEGFANFYFFDGAAEPCELVPVERATGPAGS